MRKRKGPSNRDERRVEFACVHERAANQRKGAPHKFAIGAVRESQAIAAEDLLARGLPGNRRLAKAVGGASMSEMIRRPDCKYAWYSRGFVKVGDSTRRAGHAAIAGASTADWRFQSANGIAPVAESTATAA